MVEKKGIRSGESHLGQGRVAPAGEGRRSRLDPLRLPPARPRRPRRAQMGAGPQPADSFHRDDELCRGTERRPRHEGGRHRLYCQTVSARHPAGENPGGAEGSCIHTDTYHPIRHPCRSPHSPPHRHHDRGRRCRAPLHRGQERGLPAALRLRVAGGPHPHVSTHPRRQWHWKGVCRPSHPCAEPARQQTVLCP